MSDETNEAQAADGIGGIGEWVAKENGSLSALVGSGAFRLVVRPRVQDDGSVAWSSEVHGAAQVFVANGLQPDVKRAAAVAEGLMLVLVRRLNKALVNG